MAKRIGTLAYQIVADTQQFTQGIVATKRELRQAADIAEQSRGPMGRFGDEINNIATLKRKGLLTTNQYIGAQANLIAQTTAGIPVIGRFTSVLGAGGPAAIGAAAAIGTVAVGFAAVGKVAEVVVARVKQAMDEISALGNEAEKLGIELEALQNIKFAAELKDIEFGTVTAGMGRMLATVSKGGDVFKDLGLNAKELARLAPDEMFIRIGDAIGELDDPAKKVSATIAVFGRGGLDLVRIFNEGSGAIREAAQAIDEAGARITGLDDAKVDALDQSLKKLKLTSDGFFNPKASGAAPGLKAIVDDLNAAVKGLNTNLQMTDKVLNKVTGGNLGVFSHLRQSVSRTIGGESLNAAVEGTVGYVSRRAKEEETAITEGFEAGKAAKDALNAAMSAVSETSDEGGRKLHDFGSDAARMLQAALTPAEKFKQEMQEIELLFDLGIIDPEEAAKLTTALDASQPINKTIASLNEELLALQKGAEGYAMYRATIEATNQTQVDQVAAIQHAIKEQKEHNKLLKESEEAVKGLKSPYEETRDEIQRYAEMLKEDLITEEQFTKLRENAVKDFEGGRQQRGFSNPAMLQGSQEAIAAIAAAKFGQDDVWEDMAESLRSIDGKTSEDPPVTLAVVGRLGS